MAERTHGGTSDAHAAGAVDEALRREAEALRRDAEALRRENEALRREAEALRLERDRFVTLYEQAPMGYLTLGPKGEVLQANLAVASLLGVSRERLLGRPLEEFLGCDAPQGLSVHLRDVLAGGERRVCELSVRRPDGELRYFCMESEPCAPVDCPTCRAAAGGAPCCRAVLVDSTRRVEAERLLRAEREFAERLVATAQAIILVLDPRGRILRFNPFMERLSGYRLEEVAGRDWFTTFLPDWDQSEISLLFAEHLAGGGGRHVNPIRTRDGQLRVIDWSASALRDERGETVGLLCIGWDVTERVEAQRASQRNEQRVQTILDTASDGIISIDDQGRVESFNPAAEHMFGYSAAEVLGRNVSLLMPAPFAAEHDGYLRRYLDTNEPRLIGRWRELLGKRKDGTTFPVTVGLGEHRAAGRRFYTGVLRDLSEVKALELELRQSQKLEAVGRLASGLAHEYKNMLMGIQGCTSMALEVIGDSPARYYVEEVHDAAGRGSALAVQLLTFSRRGRVDPVRMSFDGKVAEAQRLLRRTLGEAIEIVVVLRAPGAWITAGASDVEQVLFNLALNAGDAMPQGGRLTISTALLPDAEPGAARVELAVADTGVGMTPEVLERAFEPFFTTKPAGTGTGLGLSAVHGLVQTLGGKIEVETAPGRGSTFRVSLPCQDGEREAARPEPTAQAASARGRTVLVVEDEALVLLTVEHYLRRAGHQPLLASSAEQALELAALHAAEVDLLLSDVSLPRLGGRELAVAVQARCPRVQVLFMSAHSREHLLEQGLIEPGSETLEKPFNEEDLVARLVRLWGG